MKQQSVGFDEHHVLHSLRHYLPGQNPLKDFVHHNSLHSFQEQDFYKGIFSASKIFGIQVTLNLNEYRKLYSQGRIKPEILDKVILHRKGESQLETFRQKLLKNQYKQTYNPRIGQLRAFWKTNYEIDLDNRVQPIFFRILGNYLDQGIALWHFPFEDLGLINAIRVLEKNSYTSFFKSKRVKSLLHDESLSIEQLLEILVGDARYFEQYVYDQQFGHKGWSGIAATIEENPHTLLYRKKISLKDCILLELLLEIDALDRKFGSQWKPISNNLDIQPQNYFEDVAMSEFDDVLSLWQDAFEWDYYDEVLTALRHLSKTKRLPEKPKVSFQSIYCVDDRECSLRRHIEQVDPLCETYGAAGFFGVAIYFQPYGGKFYEKNCPVVITPKHLIKEVEVKHARGKEIFHSKHSHTFLKGFLLSLSLGIWASIKMFKDLLNPKMSPAISDAFAHMNVHGKLTIENKDPNDIENGLQIGYTIPEMADIVGNLLRGIGLVDNFAPLVYVMAHGSSSANNPHHGAHDCGACSGRPGSVNARIFATMANHQAVRLILDTKGINIPEETQFLGCMHDTASDEIGYYDEQILSAANQKEHEINMANFEQALDLNAKERGRRFASININKDNNHIRKEIKKRSVSIFEPRPELGHGTNSLTFIGSRERIKGLFLDRRAFLSSYDYRNDPDGDILLQVLGPLPGVCGGINLEYYFSRMDIEKMGAGTKLPHNVIGLIGVANSSDGDLRTGLPLQMIENHDPIRMLMIIEHSPEIVLKTIKSSQEIYDWFDKEWIHLIAMSPLDKELYHFHKGEFHLYKPATQNINHSEDILKTIETAQEMETNHILDATKENIPVTIYNK